MVIDSGACNVNLLKPRNKANGLECISESAAIIEVE